MEYLNHDLQTILAILETKEQTSNKLNAAASAEEMNSFLKQDRKLQDATKSLLSIDEVKTEQQFKVVKESVRATTEKVRAQKVDTRQLIEQTQSMLTHSVELVQLAEKLTGLVLPSSGTRRATLPFPPRHLADNLDLHGLGDIALASFRAFEQDLLNRQIVHLTDLQAFLREELSAAYAFLSQDEMAGLWQEGEEFSRRLSQLIRLRRWQEVEAEHHRFIEFVQWEPKIM